MTKKSPSTVVKTAITKSVTGKKPNAAKGSSIRQNVAAILTRVKAAVIATKGYILWGRYRLMNQHILLCAQISAVNHAAAVSRNRLDDLLLRAQEMELEIDEASYQVAESRREQNCLRKRKSRLQKINCTPS